MIDEKLVLFLILFVGLLLVSIKLGLWVAERLFQPANNDLVFLFRIGAFCSFCFGMIVIGLIVAAIRGFLENWSALDYCYGTAFAGLFIYHWWRLLKSASEIQLDLIKKRRSS